MNIDTGFYPLEHIKDHYTGTHRPAVSQYDPVYAGVASAFLTLWGTEYLQTGRPSILASCVPDVYALIGRSGFSGLNEKTNIWAIVGVDKHIIAYGQPEWSALQLKISATARIGITFR
jgi:hypothetical protein